MANETPNQRDDDVREFIAAVREDEYAALELSTGDHLITDWEGDGAFHPYVSLTTIEDRGREPDEEAQEQICESIEDRLGVAVRGIEWDDNNVVFHPDMDNPAEVDK